MNLFGSKHHTGQAITTAHFHAFPVDNSYFIKNKTHQYYQNYTCTSKTMSDVNST